MASIRPRGKSFSVIYKIDGKQTWETFPTKTEAEARKIEIEYQQKKGTFVVPNPTLVKDFLAEYVEMYGTTKWSHSTYSNNVSLINNYVNPIIGDLKLKDIGTKRMDLYFTQLKTQEAVRQNGRDDPGLISDRNIYEINLLLNNAFERAVDWDYIGKNPVTRNACPERKSKKRVIWEPDTAKKAISLCRDLNLLACMHLSVACSMRIGEIVGLKWQFISFGDVENGFADAFLDIDGQIQRISEEVYQKLMRKKDEIKFVFPSPRASEKELKTKLVLKSLKTDARRRTVWIPQTTASILWKLKQEQDELKEILGEEYQDFDLVIAQRNGRPIEGNVIDKQFKRFILENELPEVEFHSLRHLSTTVKLKISRGDIKAVQGDTGQATAQMVTDTYSHVLDKDLKKNALKFEKEFYGGE
jgi:integrase